MPRTGTSRAARSVSGSLPPPLLVLALGFLAGCSEDPYASLAASEFSETARVARLDERLRSLVDVPSIGRHALDFDSVGESLARELPAGATDEAKVALLSEWFSRKSGITAVVQPEDADLVPSLASVRLRAGCTSLAWAWIRAASAMGLELRPVLLPGHVCLRRPDGRFLEPLRHGMERTSTFYDSAFGLAGRPGYSLSMENPNGLSAALAVHCGLLEWRAAHLRRAASAFALAADLSPGLPEAEGNLGLVLEELGETEAARARLGKAVLGDPANTRAAGRLARLLETRKDSPP